MSFFSVEPEVSAVLGERTALDTSSHPPAIRHLHVELEGWLGDCLLEVFPAFVLAEGCADRCVQRAFTGCTFHPLDLSLSPVFQEPDSGPDLPRFVHARVGGRAGADDFGLDASNRLVVSRRALELLRDCGLRQAVVEPWERPSV